MTICPCGLPYAHRRRMTRVGNPFLIGSLSNRHQPSHEVEENRGREEGNKGREEENKGREEGNKGREGIGKMMRTRRYGRVKRNTSREAKKHIHIRERFY